VAEPMIMLHRGELSNGIVRWHASLFIDNELIMSFDGDEILESVMRLAQYLSLKYVSQKEELNELRSNNL